MQEITGQTVTVGFSYQGYKGEEAEYAAAVQEIDLQVIKNRKAKPALCSCPSAGWLSVALLSRFRRLGREYERLSSILQQLHFVVFACIMLARHAVSA